MKILVSIDDTDNIDSRGTGELAAMLSELLEGKEWGKAQAVTRHQLLVHPDIPYTSHNSCMCFAADIDADYFGEYVKSAGDFLQRESAPGSDPGLCVVDLGHLQKPEALISFGYRAKDYILSKEDAYILAERLNIHLSEHGGTGDGVIGALAGAGLRMTGNDGRFRGKMKLKKAGDLISVGEIKSLSKIETVKSLDDQRILNDTEMIRLGEKVKAVMLDGKCTLLVFPTEINYPEWQTCTTQQLKVF